MLENVWILGIATLAITGPMAVATATGGKWAKRHPLAGNLLGQLLLLCLTIGVVAVALLLLPRSASSFGLVMPTIWTVPIAPILTAVFVFVLGPWLIKLPHRWGMTGFDSGLSDLHRLPTWALALAVLIGGLSEEVLYRGVGYTLIAELVGPLLAIIVVSIAFAVAHIPLWGVGPSITTGISGCVFTAVYALTGDLWANVMAHVAVDSVGIVASRRARRDSIRAR